MVDLPSPASADGQVRLDVAGPIATITIDREAKANALTWAMVGQLRDAVARCRESAQVRVVVITGAGTRAFCAGADLSGMADTADQSAMADTADQSGTPDTGKRRGGSAAAAEPDPVAVHEARGQLAALFVDLDELGKPTIARVQGYALAGGFGLAMACDIVVAADDAVFGAPEINVGLWPFMISVPLARALPPKIALELMMTGRRIDAREAAALGCVNKVVEPAELDAAITQLATTLSSKAPVAMRIGRTAFYDTLGLPARVALARLHPLLGVLANGDEAREGIEAFAQKRPPRWA